MVDNVRGPASRFQEQEVERMVTKSGFKTGKLSTWFAALIDWDTAEEENPLSNQSRFIRKRFNTREIGIEFDPDPAKIRENFKVI